MKNKKDDTEKEKQKIFSIRINPDSIAILDDKLTTIHKNKNHRKRNNTINLLIDNFNAQDDKILRDYIEQEKPLINLNLAEIQKLKDSITTTKEQAKKDYNSMSKEIQRLNNIITEKDATIADKDKTITDTITTKDATIADNENTIKRHLAEIQRLNDKLKDNDAEIQKLKDSITTTKEQAEKDYNSKNRLLEKDNNDKSKEIQRLNNIITEKDAIIAKKDKTITDKDNTIADKDKDIKTARNDYKHKSEKLDKLHDDYNAISNENKQYLLLFKNIKKRSLFDRLLNRYPQEVLAIADANNIADDIDDAKSQE